MGSHQALVRVDWMKMQAQAAKAHSATSRHQIAAQLPVAFKSPPPAHALAKAPHQCPRKRDPRITAKYLRWKSRLTAPAVGETVASPVMPSPAAKSTAVAMVLGIAKRKSSTQAARKPQ